MGEHNVNDVDLVYNRRQSRLSPEARLLEAQMRESKVFVDTERVWRDPDGEPFPQFSLCATGGVQTRPSVFSRGDGATLSPGAFELIVGPCEMAIQLLREGTVDGLRAVEPLLVPCLKRLPPPQRQWHAYGWITAHVGEACWRRAQVEPHLRKDMLNKAYRPFSEALRAPGGDGNPWVHLRRGQLAYEMGTMRPAITELTRAYMGGGLEIFAHEDGKYLNLLQIRLNTGSDLTRFREMSEPVQPE